LLDFWPSDVTLVAVQAAVVLAPMPVAPRALARIRGTGWAWALPLSLGATVALLAVFPVAASVYTWLALVAVPVLAAVTLSGGRVRLASAGLAALLLVVAWRAPGTLGGQAAAVALTALSCVALGGWLGRLTGPFALKVGIVAMSVLDAILVFSDTLQRPNEVLNSAAPAPGLPRLQFVEFGSAAMGYGDLFVAAVLGAALVTRRRQRREAALAALACALAFDLLFLVLHELPATVPIAAALLVSEAWERRRRSGEAPARRGATPGLWARSRQAHR
jgi:hypothetical protein